MSRPTQQARTEGTHKTRCKLAKLVCAIGQIDFMCFILPPSEETYTLAASRWGNSRTMYIYICTDHEKSMALVEGNSIVGRKKKCMGPYLPLVRCYRPPRPCERNAFLGFLFLEVGDLRRHSVSQLLLLLLLPLLHFLLLLLLDFLSEQREYH